MAKISDIKSELATTTSLTPVTTSMIAVNSGKGGVGKTQFARSLLHVLQSEDVAVSAYDGDGIVGGLARMYPDACEFYDFRIEEDRGTFMNSAASGAPLILHDLPGGVIKTFSEIVDGGDGVRKLLGALRKVRTRLRMVHVLDNEIESTQSVSEFMKMFGSDEVDHVVVLNLRESRRAFAPGVLSKVELTPADLATPAAQDFPYWFTGKTRLEFLKAGGVVIAMPALAPGVRALINHKKLTFAAAIEATDDLTFQQRVQVEGYLTDFAANLEPARRLLGL
jgi:hypothetical protein